MHGFILSLMISCSMSFVNASLDIIIQTFTGILFLSHYPAEKLPSLYFASGALLVLISQLLKGKIARHYYLYTTRLHLIYIPILLVLMILMSVDSLNIMPFITAASLLIMLGLSSSILANYQNSPFNLREYKRAGKWIASFRAIGGLVSGLTIPLILMKWRPISILPLILILYLIVFGLMHSLKRNIINSQNRDRFVSSTNQLLHHPLARSIFIVFGFSTLVLIFADYNIKFSLQGYSEDAMGNILAPFFAAANGLSIILQLFIAPVILSRFGVLGLVISYMLAIFLGALCMIAWPTLHSALWMGLLIFSTQYGFFSMGRQILANSLPGSMRAMVSYQLQNLGKNIVTGISALILIPLAYTGPRAVSLFLAIGSLFIFWYLKKIREHYNAALLESINLHRFNLDPLYTSESSNYLVKQTLFKALESPVISVKLFGLDLLKRASISVAPSILYKLLQSSSYLILKKTIKLLGKIQDHDALPVLMHRLSTEKNPKIIWILIKGIASIDPTLLMGFAVQHQHSKNHYLQTSAIHIFLKAGNVDQIIWALEAFEKMLRDPDPKTRGLACEIFPIIHNGDLKPDLLLLLKDKDEEVLRLAMKIAKEYPQPEIIQAILDKVDEKELFLSVSKALVRMGSISIPPLVSAIEQKLKSNLVPKEIYILARIDGEQTELQLISLLNNTDRRIQNITSNHLAYRGLRSPYSTTARQLIVKIILRLTVTYLSLQNQMRQESDHSLVEEYQSRIWFAQKQYLNLMMAYSENALLIELLPTLLRQDKSDFKFLKALELLEMEIRDLDLKRTIPIILEGKLDHANLILSTLEPIEDPWLATVIKYKRGELLDMNQNNLINKILVLRKVALFKLLTAESLQQIALTLQEVDLPREQIIFNQGDFANGLYIVAEGEVEISADGHAIRTYQQDDFFGELSLLDDEPRSATAKTKTNCLLYLFAKEDFNRLTDDVPEVMKIIVSTLMKYLRPLLAHH